MILVNTVLKYWLLPKIQLITISVTMFYFWNHLTIAIIYQFKWITSWFRPALVHVIYIHHIPTQ